MIKNLQNKKLQWLLPRKLLDELTSLGEVFFVGGYVRDVLLQLPRTDQDILVTGINPERLLSILKKYGFADWVGKSFSVIKFHHEGHIYDVSVPSRRTDKGSFPDESLPIDDDLHGRDFTVNAIAYNISSGQFIDPTNGLNDIEMKVLRMTNDKVFDVDLLRIIRLCRLKAKLEFDIEANTSIKAQDALQLLKNIAPERIGEEFTKIMKLEKPSEAFRCMLKLGILSEILPELVACAGVTQPGGMHAYDVFEHIMHTLDECQSEPLPLARFAALFHDIAKPRHRFIEDGRAKFYGHQDSAERVARKWLVKYAFAKNFALGVAKLVRTHMFTHAKTDKGVRRFIRRVGEELLPSLFELRFADTRAQGLGGDIDAEKKYRLRVQKILDEKPPLSVRDLAVDGHDVMDILKIQESRQVGKILEKLLSIVLDDPEMNERETLLEIIREEILVK